MLISHSCRFLYTLFLAVDGNFKLKEKERRINDIELMPGWGSYVPETEYQSHIANYVDQTEVRVILIYSYVLSTNHMYNRLIRASLSMTP